MAIAEIAPIPLRKGRAEALEPGSRAPVFSPAERKILAAIAAAAIPAGARSEPGGEVSVDRLEVLARSYGPEMIAVLRGIAWLVELAPIARYARPFTKLGRERQLALLADWTEGSSNVWRSSMRALLTPLKAQHFDTPEMHALVGCRYSVETPKQDERAAWMDNHVAGSDVASDDTIECDVVVVGSGAGGAALAYDLATRGHAVVMIEAGRWYRRMEFDGRPLERTREMYLEQGLTIALGNLGTPVWAGRTVGGSTTINSGTCYRTPDPVLAEWRRHLGLAMLTPDAMAPFFERVENVLGVEEAPRAYLGAIADVIGRGAEKLGYSHGPLPRNAPGCDGQGLCAFGCPTGAKRSADVSWVPMALERGAMIFSETRVVSIDGDASRGRAIGVTARTKGGATLTVRAQATVIAGGALLTPVLLDKSGMGRNRWVGRNLSIHPAGKALATFDERQDMWRGIPQSYTIDHFQREGIMYEGGSVPLGVFASSLPMVGKKYVDMVEGYANVALFGYMLKDTSRGRVRPRPGTGHGDLRPVITYSMNRHDAQRMQRAMVTLCEVFMAAGARSVLPGVVGAEEIRTRGDLERFASRKWSPTRFEVTAYHPLGTARMARDADHGVVGPDHEHHGVRDLYVVDGSAVPSSLGVNPQITIMALALRAASILDRRLTSRAS